MNTTVTLSGDRKALLDALIRLSDEQARAIARYAKLLTNGSAKAACETFADDVVLRGTGLPISELNAFCDKIEKEFLSNERAG